jgi:hypothetical protein
MAHLVMTQDISRSVSPNKCMQAARANATWYGQSMLTGVDKLPLLSAASSREPDADRHAT